MTAALRVVGRYLLADAIASGGMATVYLARLMGEEGFSRTVALKQLHPHFSRDADFVEMFLDEARMLSRIRHPNVVSPLDVVAQDGELFIAMEYVHGEALARLAKPGDPPVPPRVASAIMTQVLFGLHASHEALDEGGQPLDIVHRDVSPQNILVGEDGLAKVVDFGIARAKVRNHTTEAGLLKGKLGYMAPEQLRFETVDRRTDIYGAGIVLWELLTGERLFATETPQSARAKVLTGKVPRPSTIVKDLPRALDDLVMHALAFNPEGRFETARLMAAALGDTIAPASVLEVGSWVEALAGGTLARRALSIAELETTSPRDLTLARPLSAPGAPAAEIAPDGGAASIAHADQSIAASSITRTPPGWRRRRSRVLVPVAALLVLGTAGTFMALKNKNEERAPSVRPAAARITPAREPERVATAEPARTETTGPIVEPVTSAPHAAAKPPKPKTRAASRCDPPYSIDANGIKHFRPECFN